MISLNGRAESFGREIGRYALRRLYLGAWDVSNEGGTVGKMALELRNQNGSASLGPTATPTISRTASVYGNSDYYRNRNNTVGLTNFHIRRVDPRIRPIASSGRARNALTRSSISPHNRETWLFDIPYPHRANQYVDRARRYALNVCFLNHGHQRFLGRTAWFQKRRGSTNRGAFGICKSTEPARVSQNRSR